MPWPLLQVPRLWAPQCLAGFSCTHIRLRGIDAVATFPAAVGMALLLPQSLSLYTCFSPRDWGLESIQLRGFGLQAAPKPGVAVPKCRAKIQGKAEGLSLCVCLSCLVVPSLSLICLVSLCVEPWASLGPAVSSLSTSPWLVNMCLVACS